MVILDLVEALQPLAEGAVATVRLEAASEIGAVRAWCERTGNTLTGVTDDWVEVRRGRLPVSMPGATLPARLWLYTNFDCNLACDYCCVRSSPQAQRRALGIDRIGRLVEEAPGAGVGELFLTGGEPFTLPDIDRIVRTCAAALPTTLLTNGMLFQHGRRLEALRQMPREGFALQISLDAPTPEVHDRHRGAGSWHKAMAGIRLAQAEAFRVRVATTVTEEGQAAEMRAFLDDLGVPRDDQVIRPLARRGLAQQGIVLTAQGLIPEVTVTADGVYWHPVAADDEDMLVTTAHFPLADAVEQVRRRVRVQQWRTEALAEAFVCA